MTSCDKSELNSDTTLEHIEKARWYGSKLAEGNREKGVSDGTKRWNPDAGIYIKFINAPTDAQMIDKIKQIAAEWEAYAGINFHFTDQDKKADVRIAFNWNGNDWLTWSYTGTDAKYVRSQSEPTAVFGGLEYASQLEFKGDVLRLFGQILGLEYEQRHQEWSKNGYWKDAASLQRYWEEQFEGYNMDWNEIREYVFDPLTAQNANQLLQTEKIDELSVMAWPYYNRKQTSKLLANYELSDGDKMFIAQLYPKKSLPTIQEAWVDAGYFVWKDNTKTALEITFLGQEQQYLPDVSDGEQLISAVNMFRNAVNLKRAPQFNTSNITSFSSMFISSHALTDVPVYNTSKGINFSNMFSFCGSLKNIPQFDTSNGVDFTSMFTLCTSLTTLPLLNTSKGSIFDHMFSGCTSLTTVPKFDVSNGKDFGFMFFECTSLSTIPDFNASSGKSFTGMFVNCTSLTSVPEFNVSSGEWFSDMFSGCKSLVAVPKFNTSNGKYFNGMFRGCKSLTSISLFDTSNGEWFDNMFQNCTSLTTVPLFNTSKGITFSGVFSGCTSLTSVPLFNTSNGRKGFDYMFENCTSLTTVPLFNTSNGEDFRSMFAGCTSLTTVPSFNTSKGIDFEYMFYKCRSLANKPQLDLSNARYTAGMFEGTPFQ